MNFIDQRKQLEDLHGDLEKVEGEEVDPIVWSWQEKLKKILAGEKWKALKVVKNIITPFVPRPIAKIADAVGNHLKTDTMAESKKVTQSKTIITAILVGIAGLLAVFGVIPEEAVSPDAGWVATAVAVVMFALRLVTKQPIQTGQ